MLRGMRRNKEKQKKREFKIYPGAIVTAFAASGITFFLLLNIEKNILQDYEKELVWVTCEDISKSVQIEAKTMKERFCQIEVDKSVLPEGKLTDIHMIEGSQTAFAIPKGTVLSESMFIENKEYVENLKNPVIIGCKADDLYQVASGVLRRGDVVNVYTVNGESGETCLLWSDVLIDQTFDSGGSMIAPEDTISSAARINLLMDEPYVEQFYTELYNGSLRMVRVVR